MERVPTIGIDFGTSYSCVGVYQNGKINIIPNDIGERKTPSYVSFTNDGILVGDEAKNKISNLNNTIFSVKRLLGRNFEDQQIGEYMKLWPFKIVKDPKSNRAKIQVIYLNQERNYYPEEIIAMILRKLKKTASKFLSKEVKDAVITVPCSFNDYQRQLIRDAGTISGINVLRIINEVDAVGLTYGFINNSKKEKNILFFNLGGGYLNVSVTSLEDCLIEVKAINGLNNLGGEDFDNKLVEYCVEEFRHKTHIDIKKNAKALRRVRTHCEKAKIILSGSTQTTIDIDSLIEGEDLNIVITRNKFEELCMDLFKKCIDPIERVLRDARIHKNQIDEIVLVGDSTRIPKIQQIIQEFFNGKELNKTINPEESIAYGAAIQAAIMTNVKDENIEKFILMNVTAFSLGIETTGGVMTVFIPRNSTVPTKKTIILFTSVDNQTSFPIQIFEGERQLTKDNYKLGEFVLEGIPPKPKGETQIEITFDIDCNFIIQVSAVEKSSGKSKKLTITNNKNRLTKEEIKKIIEEFEKEESKKDNIEAKNKYLYACIDIKDKIDSKMNGLIKKIINDPNTSKEDYNAKIKKIEDIFYPVIKKINDL